MFLGGMTMRKPILAGNIGAQTLPRAETDTEERIDAFFGAQGGLRPQMVDVDPHDAFFHFQRAADLIFHHGTTCGGSGDEHQQTVAPGQLLIDHGMHGLLR